MRPVYLTAVLLLVLIFGGRAAADNGLALLQIEHGARPAGMGAAFVSVTDDPNGVAYNPASIVALSKFTASFGHTVYWENVRLESGFFAMNLSSRTFLHGGIRFAVVDEIEQRVLPTSEPESYFDVHDVSFKSGLSYRFSENISAGLSLGWFVEKIEAWRGSAFNVDIGVTVRPQADVNIGASVTGLGSDFNLSKPGSVGSRDISLPTTCTVGGSYTRGRILAAADIVYLADQAHLHLGAEGRLHEIFQLRAGVMTGYDSKNITAGASFTKRNLTIDYAFVPYSNDLGTSHMFNLTFTL
ncbi:MAG: PorV/PorQ family protein [Candidatus Zixiibacteriota bacterium]|nr:MAG: PorV/PorQ family protein [candidate division Zixibacteria bacterium]